MPIRFADITVATPTKDSLAARYQAIEALLEQGARPEAIAAWDKIRREYDSWSALVHLRFAQDTTDAEAKAARDYADALAPEATGARGRAEAPPAGGRRTAPAWRRWSGAHALRLWETDVTTFDPAIAADLEEESQARRALHRDLLGLGEARDRRRRP